MARTFFRVTHEYDIGDRSVYFSFDESQIDETAKELAVYLQFKAEHAINDELALDNVTVVRFLILFGAKQLESEPNGDITTIDMYWDRERSCGPWYLENYESLDEKYGDKAHEFLLSEVEENQLMGECEVHDSPMMQKLEEGL
ncbi:TPA: hypothetical protein ACMDWD_003384 [Vibrio cholerae]